MKFNKELNVPNCPGCGEWCTVGEIDHENTYKGSVSYSTWFKCPGTCETMPFDTKENKYDNTKSNDMTVFIKQMRHSDQEVDNIPKYRANALSSGWNKAAEGYSELVVFRNDSIAERASKLAASEKRKEDAINGTTPQIQLCGTVHNPYEGLFDEIQGDVENISDELTKHKRRFEEFKASVEETMSKLLKTRK